jgi:hypothetical protein
MIFADPFGQLGRMREPRGPDERGDVPGPIRPPEEDAPGPIRPPETLPVYKATFVQKPAPAEPVTCPEGYVLMERLLPTGEKVKDCIPIETPSLPITVPTPPEDVAELLPFFTPEAPTLPTPATAATPPPPLPAVMVEKKGWPWWSWLLLAGGVAGAGTLVYFASRRR